jgi:hypothetical protein
MEVFPDDKNRPQDGDQRQTIIGSFEQNDVRLIWASRAPFTRKAPRLITQAGTVLMLAHRQFPLGHRVRKARFGVFGFLDRHAANPGFA